MVKPKNVLSLSRTSSAISMRRSRLRHKYLQDLPRQSSTNVQVNTIESVLLNVDSSNELSQAIVNEPSPIPLPSSFDEVDIEPDLNNQLRPFLTNNSSLIDDDDSLAQELRECFVLCGTPAAHVTMLLKIIQKRHPNLPGDSRTLLETPTNFNIRKMQEGRYIHFGLEKELTSFLHRLSVKPVSLTLDFHLDGVKISDSSSVSLWTILCEYVLMFLFYIIRITQHYK